MAMVCVTGVDSVGSVAAPSAAAAAAAFCFRRLGLWDRAGVTARSI